MGTAFHQRAAAAVPLDEAIEFILCLAATPEGVSLRQVADFCEVSTTAAQNRIQAACEKTALHRAQRLADIGGRAQDVRWFVHQHDADMFVAGQVAPSPMRAQERQPVQVVAINRHGPAMRAGADDHRQWGSRRGDHIRYLDGTELHISETA